MHGWLEPQGPHGTMVYWRRRACVAILLLVGLATLGSVGRGLLTWRETNPVQEKIPSPVAVVAASPSATPGSAVAEPQKPEQPAVTASPSIKACEAKDMKISLAGSNSVKSGADEVITVAVLNAGQQSCALTINETFELKVTSGADQIWTTAHCSGWRGDAVTELESGKYREWQITWGTRRSAAECQLTGDYLQPGTYAAQAAIGEQKSKKLVVDVVG
ncbi:MAG: hypothetical protein ACRDAX_08060 [Propionibacteriaceae bacterium]